MPEIIEKETEKMGLVYEIKNDNGVHLVTSPQGARLISFLVPVDGQRELIVGYDSIENHRKKRYYGATIGPVAGRISKAAFTIDHQTYQTESNEKGNTLHGGYHGLDTETWAVEIFQTEQEAGVIYRTNRKDGDYGFPADVAYQVAYTLRNDNSFTISYDAVADKATLFNPTNHSYFNLTGDPKIAIDTHLLEVHAQNIAETNEDVTTTGEAAAVANTAFDFRTARPIGDTLLDTPFLLDHDQKEDLILKSPDQKVTLTVKTDTSAVVLYTTGDDEVGEPMKNGPMAYHGALAIEPQHAPGAEKYPRFGDIVLRPNKPHHSETMYQVFFK